MTVTSPTEIRNIAVIGHKGSGKTALIEAMMYLANALPKGVTRTPNTHFLDETPEEKAHVATLESRLQSIYWAGKKINVVDTPGEASALVETRLALGAVDAAVLAISAKDGVQSGTDRFFRWATEAKMPTLVVLTRIDDEHARTEEVIHEIRERLKTPLSVLTLPAGSGAAFDGVLSVLPRRSWIGAAETPGTSAKDGAPAAHDGALSRARAQLAEAVAETDDRLTEAYLTDGDLPDADISAGLQAAIASRAVIPVLSVSSVRPAGVLALLDAVVDLVPAPKADASQPFKAWVFKTHIDPHTGRSSFARILSGSLRTDDNVVNANDGQKERVGVLLEGAGKNAAHLDHAVAGDMVGVTKLKATRTGQTLADPAHADVHEGPVLPPSLFSRAVVLESKGLAEKVSVALEKIVEEDTALSLVLDEATHDLVLSGLGAMHLELTLERLRRRAGIDCKLGPPRIAYRETISKAATNIEGKQKKQTGGHGQFGVCFVDITPLPRGEGFVFDDAIVGGVIPRQFIPSVEKGLVRGMKQGPLAGYPVVDVKARLYDGKHHSVDSSDAAFQVAGFRAMRQGLAAAGPVILEPQMNVEVTIPSQYLGDVIGDMSSRGGRILGTDGGADVSVVRATAPLSQLLEYEPRLSGMTQGRGTFTMVFDRYDVVPAHMQEKVVKESGYKAAADEE